MMNIKFLKLPALAAAALKLAMIHLSIVQPLLAVDLCASAKTSQMNQDQLEKLVQEFETMSLLDAKKALENISCGMDKLSLQKAFLLAQKKDNAIAMAVLANQFKILQGGADVLSNLASIEIGIAEAKASLTVILGEMIEETQKSPQWSNESIRLTTDAIRKRSQKTTQEVEKLVKTILGPLLVKKSKNIKDPGNVLVDDNVHLFIHDIKWNTPD